jgi:glycerate-2-kinase
VVRAAFAAADAGRLVQQALAEADVREAIRSAAAVDVIAAGKAAAPMLAAFAGAGIEGARHLLGIAATRPSMLPEGARWHGGSHPAPDPHSEAAARSVLEIARGSGQRDLLILLLSGGASSMMALPAEGITLADKRRVSELLLNDGAEIHELNAVRKHLSAIKGGWLAVATSGSVLTLALSDVAGDDLATIGSGPAVADTTTFADALAVLERHGGRREYPGSVVTRLDRGAAGAVAETPKPGDGRLSRSRARVIGGARNALDGARAAAESLGYAVHVVDEPVTGEARVAAHRLLELASRTMRTSALRASAGKKISDRPMCILAAGETAVRVDRAGKGGRNQECALAMARGLDALGKRVVAASVGTDGMDGPTDAAGAIVDSTTLSRAGAADIGPPERYLETHNSYLFFDELGDLLRTGPTGTNVGDLQVILIGATGHRPAQNVF